MGKITVDICLTNQIDIILADCGLMPRDRVCSTRLENAIVDTGATRLCLPAHVSRFAPIQNSEFRVRLGKFGGKKIYTPNFSQN